MQTVLAILLLSAASGARVQTPAGRVSGTVADTSGGRLTSVEVRLTSRSTGLSRVTQTSEDGEFSIDALIPGAYLITADLQGFARARRDVQVDAGSRTVADLVLALGDVAETVAVQGALSLMRPDDHYVGGVVTRAQVDNLPLNGRNFLDLAKLEPGVSNPARAGFGRTFVPVLGSGLSTIPRVGFTRVTIDGASITSIGGAPGTFMQLSQEAVQEFQLSSAAFDPTTGLTSNGAVNVATRTAGRDAHAEAFGFFRDHNMSAYPALNRDPANPDPFFQRAQYGGTAGGALWSGRLFVFGTAEHGDDHSVVTLTVPPTAPQFMSLGGIFATPSSSTLGTVRVDAPLGRRNTAYARYTLDRNSTFSGGGLPSAWTRLTNHVNQAIVSLTTTITPAMVNAVRVSRFRVSTNDQPADDSDCHGCFGLGVTRTAIAETGVTFGRAKATVFDGTRYQLSDDVAWQHREHRLRFGADWQHDSALGTNPDTTWTEMTLWSPASVQHAFPDLQLPTVFASPADAWQLSLQSFDTSVGPPTTPWRNFSAHRIIDVYRLYVADNWNVADRLTVDGGLGWSLEPNALNSDLSKPALLTPLLGENGLHPPRVSYTNFSPSVGAVWSVTHDHRTLLRGGAGRYLDPISGTNSVNLANERFLITPLGTGRLTQTGDNIPFGNGTLSKMPSTVTGSQLINLLLPTIQQQLQSWIDPSNRDFSITNLDRLKEGTNLYDPAYQSPSSLQLTLGIQRELPARMVASADVVWKGFSHTFINGVDYNHYYRSTALGGRVIPKCGSDSPAQCSNGPLSFDTTTGRASYKGLLVRVERRFDGRFQLLGSYTLGSYTGTNGTGLATAESTGGRVFGFNNDNWYENIGPLPTDVRHMLSVSGIVRLPWDVRVATSIAAYSRPPFSAYVGNMDFNGDGTMNDLLPGTTINAFNRSLNEADLRRLVDAYNVTYANTVTAGGQLAPYITLPPHFSFDDNFFTQDVRVSKAFLFGPRRFGVTLLMDVFNVLNVANLVQFSGNLAVPRTFGQPAGRFTQLFGSGGPRAAQIGARIGF
jgi:hypothetical protein